jgi:hypothetical protein
MGRCGYWAVGAEGEEMSDWQPIAWSDIRQGQRRRVGHSFAVLSRKVPWLRACAGCGLVPLKNKLTEVAIKAGCEIEE